MAAMESMPDVSKEKSLETEIVRRIRITLTSRNVKNLETVSAPSCDGSSPASGAAGSRPGSGP